MNQLIKTKGGSEDEFTAHGVEVDISLGSFKFNRSKVLINIILLRPSFYAFSSCLILFPVQKKKNVFQVFLLLQTAIYLGTIYPNLNTTTCSN